MIDKVLLKDNVPAMSYYDYMKYEKTNGDKIATKDELLQMYLQKDEINKILRKHNGDILDTWFGSSSESVSSIKFVVHLGFGYCYTTDRIYCHAIRAVVDLKSK